MMSALHFNDLPAAILHTVFGFLFRDILHEYALLDDYSRAMDIATVCRLWGALMPSFVYHFVLVQRRITVARREQHGRPTEKVVWLSNITSIRYQQKSRLATGLRIVMNDDYTGPLQLTNALLVFGLTFPPLTSFRTLQFFGRGILRSGTDSRTPDMHADAMSFCNFIRPNYKSLESIILRPTILSPRVDVSDTLNAADTPQSFNFAISPRYQLLLLTYIQKLTHLMCYAPASLVIHAPVTLNLTTLELNLDCLWQPEHVEISDIATLETIKLTNIRGQTPLIGLQSEHTALPALPNLKVLQLGFKKVPDSSEKDPELPARLVRSYPKLSELTINRSAGIYRDLYFAFRDAPLRLLQINENHRALAHINTEIIRNIDCLHLETIKPDEGDWWDDPTHFVTRFYSADSAVRRAVLDVTLPFPAHINWHNLVRLSLSTDMVTVTRIVRLLEQLTLLKYLRIKCISMDPHDPYAYFWGSSNRQADIRSATEPTVVDCVRLDGALDAGSIEAFNNSLQVFAIDTPNHFDEDSLSKLLLFLPALKIFAVDTEYAGVFRANVERFQLDVSVCLFVEVDRYFKLE